MKWMDGMDSKAASCKYNELKLKTSFKFRSTTGLWSKLNIVMQDHGIWKSR